MKHEIIYPEPHVAKLGDLDGVTFEKLRAEVMACDALWSEAYGDYQSGGWDTVSVMNDTGNENDVIIRDCAAVPTRLLASLPTMQKLLEDLGLNIMWARLAKQGTNSFLYEHVDYNELDQVGRHRIHIPILTNSSCYFVEGGWAIHMAERAIWRIAPVHPHGACNRLGSDRIHLIVDCYENEQLREMIAKEVPAEATRRKLSHLTGDAAEERLQHAGRLLSLGFAATAEKALLRLFFDYRSEPGQCYSMIRQMYEAAGELDKASFWDKKRRIMMGAEQ